MATANLRILIGTDLAAGEFNRAFKQVGKHIENLGKQLKKVGTELTKTITLPIAALGGAALASSKMAVGAFKSFGEQTRSILGRLGDEIFRAVNIQGILNTVVSLFDDMVTAFENLDPAIKSVVVGVGAMVAALGPAVFLGGQLLQGFANLQKIMQFLGAHPLVVVIGGLVALSGALALAIRNVHGGNDAFEGMGDNVARAATEVERLERQLKKLETSKDRIEPLEREIAKLEDLVERSSGAFKQFYERHLAGLNAELKELVGLTSDASKEQLQHELAIKKSTKASEDYGEALKIANKLEAAGGDAREVSSMRLAAQKTLLKETLPLYAAGSEEIRLQVAALRLGEAESERMKEQEKERTAGAIQGWNNWTKSAESANESLRDSGVQLWSTFSSGAASGLAAAAISGEGFRQTMIGVFDSVAQAGIKMVIEIFFQTITAAISEIAAKSVAAHAGIPFVGIALGLAAAAAGIVGARALAKKEKGKAFAEGGLVRGPTFGLVGEAGPEVITPLDRFEKMMGAGRGGSQTIIVQLDGRPILRYVAQGWPQLLRLHGATAS